jgi:hypothetical protein
MRTFAFRAISTNDSSLKSIFGRTVLPKAIFKIFGRDVSEAIEVKEHSRLNLDILTSKKYFQTKMTTLNLNNQIGKSLFLL